jgi:hypothetical protein
MYIHLSTNIHQKKVENRVSLKLRESKLTRIPTPYRVYLIDTGKEGRARDSRPPQPQPRVARGDGPGGG